MFNSTVLARFFPNTQTIAVVGNGPVSPEDGEHVAKANVVVRFNNWASRGSIDQPGIPKRADIVFTNGGSHSSIKSQVHPTLVVLANPYPHYWDTADRDLMRFYPQSHLTHINPFWMRDLCKSLNYDSKGYAHPLPTVGLVGIYALMKISKTMNYFITGFTWGYDEVADTIQGHKLDNDSRCKEKKFNHNFFRELLWTSRSIEHISTVKFSTRSKTALDRVRGRRFTSEYNWPLYHGI
jgi:hypothetical protein